MSRPLNLQENQIGPTLVYRLCLAVIVMSVLLPYPLGAQVSASRQAPLADTTRIDESTLLGEILREAPAASELDLATRSDQELLPDARVQDTTEKRSVARIVDQRQDGLIRAPYIGFGIGRSDLNPDSRDVQGANITDDSQIGFQVTLGVDINRWLSAELHVTDFGDLELLGDSDSSFKDYGLSALWYFNQNRAAYNREGLGLFGRAGFGYLSVGGGDRLNFDNTEGLHAALGAGLEYSMRQGLAIRAEGTTYGGRVNYLQLGVLYRFGEVSSWASRVPFIGGSSTKSRQGIARITANVQRVPTINDTDGDGVLEANDSCPDTPLTAAVGDNGCMLFNGVIDGLTFTAGSATLTPDARVVLQSVVKSLLQSPDARVRVVAHTDSLGDASANMLLSRKRAFEVAKFLVESGVSKERLEARAFGEVRPIDTDSTAVGRQRNRRVEIDLIAQ